MMTHFWTGLISKGSQIITDMQALPKDRWISAGLEIALQRVSVAATSAITHDDIGKSCMFIVRGFQFPVHVFAGYSLLLNDSILGHFLSSLKELSAVLETPGHAAASFSFSLAK